MSYVTVLFILYNMTIAIGTCRFVDPDCFLKKNKDDGLNPPQEELMDSGKEKLFDEMVGRLAIDVSEGKMLDDCMELDAKIIRNVPLRCRLIAQAFVMQYSLDRLNQNLASRGLAELYSRSQWEAGLIFAFQNGWSYNRWRQMSSEYADLMAEAALDRRDFSGASVTYADLRNYLVRNSDEEGGRLYTRRLTQRLEKEILSAAPDEESFREFMRANVQSFTRVREKTRYYLCKYLYYDLTTRIDRYILALQKGHVREEVMESLSVFRGISVLKRKKQSPAQAREILENSAVSLGEVFDSFNYFYFGYATLDWMAVLIEACDSPEDLTERQKKAVLRSARRFSPALTAVSDKEALERVWQLEDEKEEELDRVYSLDSKTRGYQRGRGGENTLRKYLQGQLDLDRTTLISFLLFFGSEAELPEGQQITKDRLSSILKECGFAPLREQEEFDRFVIGFLQSRKSAEYLVEQVLAYAQEEKNFFLYKTWLNSDSAYDWMTKLLS